MGWRVGASPARAHTIDAEPRLRLRTPHSALRTSYHIDFLRLTSMQNLPRSLVKEMTMHGMALFWAVM